MLKRITLPVAGWGWPVADWPATDGNGELRSQAELDFGPLDQKGGELPCYCVVGVPTYLGACGVSTQYRKVAKLQTSNCQKMLTVVVGLEPTFS